MGNVVEVEVRGTQYQTMQQNQRGDPKIVDRNRRSVLAQLIAKLCAIESGRRIRNEEFNGRGFQESLKRGFVPLVLCPPLKPKPQLGQGKYRKTDTTGSANHLNPGWFSKGEVAIDIRIKGDVHFQSSSSIRSHSSMASLNAASCTQVPIRKSRFWCTWRSAM